ncbi:MAG: hypothetical protein Q8R07_04110, partial [Candidatus Uhrbacteria bacterium]|nr:hypothetical protein [Candidatus Uhrbacteria bacterium]
MAQFSIMNGPSKFDLMLALFDRDPEPSDLPRTVIFMLLEDDGHATRSAMIDGVQVEDGSGESWNIEGQLWYSSLGRYRPFKAYYS